MRKGLSYISTMVLLTLISVAIVGLIYVGVTEFAGKSNVSHSGVRLVKIEGVSLLPNGSLAVYVNNYGDDYARIDLINFVDASGKIVATYKSNVKIPPNKISRIVIPKSIINQIREKHLKTVKLELISSDLRVFWERPIRVSSSYKQVYIAPFAIKALRNVIQPGTHWVVFNVETGQYYLYDNTSSVIRGPYVGSFPIIRNTDSYQSPQYVNYPITIVVNPTKADRDWIFTWIYNGSSYSLRYNFLLEKLDGHVYIDFLVFWGDLFDPYIGFQQVSGELRAEVFRVTVFENGTYRIASYMAAGAFGHQVLFNVTSNNPLDAILVYEKPPHQGWSYAIMYNGTACFKELKVYKFNS